MINGRGRPLVDHPRGRQEGQVSLSSWHIQGSGCLLYVSPTASRQMVHLSHLRQLGTVVPCACTMQPRILYQAKCSLGLGGSSQVTCKPSCDGLDSSVLLMGLGVVPKLCMGLPG
ncbi:hypothetical protein Tco_1356081 [Tanacetum coccineum]